MAGVLALPLIDLASPDRDSSAKSIRKACVDYGFFYLVNHGIEESFFQQVLEESKKFFSLPLDEKMKLKTRKDNRGYDPLPSLTLDSSSEVQGNLHEGFCISSSKISYSQFNANQWPPEGMRAKN